MAPWRHVTAPQIQNGQIQILETGRSRASAIDSAQDLLKKRRFLKLTV
jgi:hypothetical protein